VQPYANLSVTARPGHQAPLWELLIYLVLGLTLMVLDVRDHWLLQWRSQANTFIQPFWSVAGLPGQVENVLSEYWLSRHQLVKENRQLREQWLLAQAQLTRLENIQRDNARLHERLNVVEHSGLDVQLVRILNIDLDPVRQRLVLAAGRTQGLEVGQAVIDADGLIGQIIEVGRAHSTVLLLTDPDHAVPVTVARTGVRLIAWGRGDRLELRNIPLSAGVEVGDHIITSGLGGRFPAGFPVGTVLNLHSDDTHTFLIGELQPAAHLDRGRDVLVLRNVSVPVVSQPPPTPANADTDDIVS